MRKSIFRHLITGFAILLIFLFLGSACQSNSEESALKLRFGISFTEKLEKEPLDGRMLLMISNDDSREPRFQISARSPNAQLVFGINVDRLAPDDLAVFDASVFGYPLRSLSEIPKGEYTVQALLHRYETFHRSDGHVVKLPMDRGEGQRWNLAPGNLYSTPQKVQIDPQKGGMINITLDQKIPPFSEPEDTKYIKHLKIQSKLLTEFWGRPMHLGAIILLPEGFEEHPDARYPLMIYQGHHHRNFETLVRFQETPPDPDKKHEYADVPGPWGEFYRIHEEYSHKLYKDWTSPDFPRMIIVTIQHANPYFDDSYAVNSSNLGPYGDAITYELIPYIEENFRGIGEGWARTLYGGSTGGWESLAVQIFYPNEYNGTWTFCPDPIDFRAHSLVNIYEHKNAYYVDSQWKRTPIPGFRNWLGHVLTTNEEANHLELVIGTNARSGYQNDIWQAVFGPVGEDGYPKPIWDKLTGEIDHSVAEYWRENYDLRYILERDWDKLGPELEGKIHIYTGDMDNWYLNNAVYLMEEFLESTENPYYGGLVEYGDRHPHCWCGDHTVSLAVSMLTLNQRFAPIMAEHIRKKAPPGADITSWRY